MQTQYKKFSALIIDDEEDICMLLRMILKKHNIDVHVALNLEDGIRTTALVKPSVIFLDNNLPDGLGIENIGKIKTTMQILALLVLLGSLPEWKSLVGVGVVCLYVAAALTLWSMMAYLKAAWPHLQKGMDKP